MNIADYYSFIKNQHAFLNLLMPSISVCICKYDYTNVLTGQDQNNKNDLDITDMQVTST